MIQVRLDDDAEALVRANKEAHGGSLSKAANRLLRASAAKPRVTITRQPDLSSGTGSAIIPRVRVEAPKRVGRCSHPLLRRIGSACAVCGATIG